MATYGVQSVPWGEYGQTNYYTRPPQTYRDIADVMGLDYRTLGANLRYLYDPTDPTLFSGMERAIGSYYDTAQNDYLRYINQLMGSTPNSTPTTVADVLRQRGGGSLEAGTAGQITDLASLEAAGAQSAIERALSSFIPSQKAALRSRSGATRSLSEPDAFDQSIKAAWAPLVANAASGQYANSSNTARNQVANVAQGNNDLYRQLATYSAQNAANFGLERARALTALNNTRLGYLGNVGQSLLQGAMSPQMMQVQSFPRAGTSMLGTMSNATGGFMGGGGGGMNPTPTPEPRNNEGGGGGGAVGSSGGGQTPPEYGEYAQGGYHQGAYYGNTGANTSR